METQTALSVVCRLGKSRLISGVYPEQFELRSSLFDGLKTRQNPESTNYRYGTLICDLERGLPIDVLPDRTVETVSAWLKEHPSIDTISRDGSSEYASVQMERESGRFRKKCWPLFTPYCQKRDSSNHQFGRNTGRNS